MNPSREIADINQIMKRIVQALSNSTVNVSYALKFIQNDQGLIPVEEMQQLLELIKVEFTATEREALIDFISEHSQNNFIRSQYFLD